MQNSTEYAQALMWLNGIMHKLNFTYNLLPAQDSSATKTTKQTKELSAEMIQFNTVKTGFERISELLIDDKKTREDLYKQCCKKGLVSRVFPRIIFSLIVKKAT